MTQPLKLGTAQYAYLFKYTLEHALEEIQTMGFRYVEIITAPPQVWPPSLDRRQRKALRKRIEQLGLELVAINPTYLDINMASPNPGIREESIKQIMEQITLANDLGAKLIVVIVGKRHPLIAPPVEVVWERYAREGVFRCVEHAEKNRVVFGLEQGPSLFIDSSEKMLFVLNEVKSPYLKIVFDAANASVVEPVVPALDRVRDHIVHVHLSDTDCRRWSHSSIGKGKIDFRPIAEKLKEINYSGVSILETTDHENPRESIVGSVETLSRLGWQV